MDSGKTAAMDSYIEIKILLPTNKQKQIENKLERKGKRELVSYYYLAGIRTTKQNKSKNYFVHKNTGKNNLDES